MDQIYQEVNPIGGHFDETVYTPYKLKTSGKEGDLVCMTGLDIKQTLKGE